MSGRPRPRARGPRTGTRPRARHRPGRFVARLVSRHALVTTLSQPSARLAYRAPAARSGTVSCICGRPTRVFPAGA
ncbi:hypothetical protein L843_3754 [Mycobacterium intracellulare MIN_061107_1834]|nr:hypothetical protein L843_3754 [Mycobacterium intracellulare MIN_061107_1834]